MFKEIMTETLAGLGGVFSRVLNALFFKGSMHQSTSAHFFVRDQMDGGVWTKRRRAVDAMFFWQEEHCLGAWYQEVDRAKRTLDKNTILVTGENEDAG